MNGEARPEALVLIVAWKAPDRVTALLELSDPVLREERRKLASEWESATSEALQERLKELASAQAKRFRRWADARFGQGWGSFAPDFRTYLAREWSDHERSDPAEPGTVGPAHPQAGTV